MMSRNNYNSFVEEVRQKNILRFFCALSKNVNFHFIFSIEKLCFACVHKINLFFMNIVETSNNFTGYSKKWCITLQNFVELFCTYYRILNLCFFTFPRAAFFVKILLKRWKLVICSRISYQKYTNFVRIIAEFTINSADWE